MSNSTLKQKFDYTLDEQAALLSQFGHVMEAVNERQRPAARVSLALQAAISDDDIVVVPKVTTTPTGKVFHVTGNAQSAKEAIDALNCPVKWGLAETPEKIPLIIQPVDCRARFIPLGRVRTTEEIYNFPKILPPTEFFALGAKFPKEQCEAPILDVWLDAVGRFWYAILTVNGVQRDVDVRQAHPVGQWRGHYRVPVRE
ncbi:MAG: hypothetical protein UU95_C0016G0035 [Parcubacteria group bacterium GW2011_GWC2_42_12]|nr:MAG: hypothetical protein UU95_C0016G0035 [Parcubacteria group bacterium GW2011_GWC2_42_12]